MKYRFLILIYELFKLQIPIRSSVRIRNIAHEINHLLHSFRQMSEEKYRMYDRFLFICHIGTVYHFPGKEKRLPREGQP